MNDAWGYNSDEVQGETEMNGPKALRDAYKALKQQNDELNQKLTSFLETQQKQQMATVFSTLGVPEAAQKLYQGDANPEAVSAWVNEMRSAFGTGTAQGDTTPAPVQTQPALNAEQAEQYQRMTQAGSEGTPMGNVEAAQLGVNNATDLQGLIAAFQNGMNRQ